tara:strand:- start:68 stop:190 length:123 start_codon:yes stop_codon:yes gene_type:complete
MMQFIQSVWAVGWPVQFASMMMLAIIVAGVLVHLDVHKKD